MNSFFFVCPYCGFEGCTKLQLNLKNYFEWICPHCGVVHESKRPAFLYITQEILSEVLSGCYEPGNFYLCDTGYEIIVVDDSNEDEDPVYEEFPDTDEAMEWILNCKKAELIFEVYLYDTYDDGGFFTLNQSFLIGKFQIEKTFGEHPSDSELLDEIVKFEVKEIDGRIHRIFDDGDRTKIHIAEPYGVKEVCLNENNRPLYGIKFLCGTIL